MLNKSNLSVNFSNGLDLKTDPFQVSPGKFLSLNNSIFDKAGRLTKRNGFGPLTSLPDSSALFLTTFNGNLTAVGTKLQAYSSSNMSWIDRGTIEPVSLEVLPLVRSNTNQIQADSAIASNGLICTVFTDIIPENNMSTPVIKYCVADSVTGQNIIAPTPIPVASGVVTGSARVYVLGTNFIILFTNLIGSTSHLQYVAIATANPKSISLNTDIAASYIPSDRLSYDAAVYGNNLYIAYNTLTGGQSVKVTYLTYTLNLVTPTTYAGAIASNISVTVDTSNPLSVAIWVVYYDVMSEDGYVTALNPVLNTILAPTLYTTGTTFLNITSIATNGSITVLGEVINTYGYDNTKYTNYIEKVSVTGTGTVGTTSTLVRSIGLASKAFLIESDYYFLGLYQSDYQPSYFLMNHVGQVISKLAYSNGPGYYQFGLPNVSITDSLAQVSYLYKDLVQSANKSQGITSSTGVYAQLGVNLASFGIGNNKIITSEIGNNLNMSGGFMSMYDGYSIVENNFFLYPDYVETTPVADYTVVGNTTNLSVTLTSINTTANVRVGMNITGTNIPANTKVVSFTSDTITLSNFASATGSTISFTLTGNLIPQTYFYQATYEWADNQGNLFRSAPSIPVQSVLSTDTVNVVHVPTLRLTYKTANPVKLVLYRWSTAQQLYYQVTSILLPTLNDTSVDYIDILDSLSDQEIIGNNLIYTTGGVIENIAPPSFSLLTLFNNRLWGVVSEDRNLLWYSKQVIEATPVEMSDLFTIYAAPTTGSQGSTGSISAIAPMDDKLIIFKRDAIGYINGIGPDNTGANSQYSDFTLINSVVGCENQQSIVFTPQGLMFQSDKGIWILGRDLSTNYIGAPVESLTMGATVLSAINIPATNQVRFTLDSGITLMYDYFFGQWGTFTNIPAISSTIYNSLHTGLNNLGQVFQETPGYYLDNSLPVLMSFTTSWISLAGVQGYERFYQMYMLGTYLSPFKLNVQFAYDYNLGTEQSVIVTPDFPGPVYGSYPLWGSGEVWGGKSSTFKSRVFPKVQKCETFQITMNEIFDPSFGVTAGAGLTLSGMDLVVGLKKGYRTSSAARSFG